MIEELRDDPALTQMATPIIIMKRHALIAAIAAASILTCAHSTHAGDWYLMAPRLESARHLPQCGLLSAFIGPIALRDDLVLEQNITARGNHNRIDDQIA